MRFTAQGSVGAFSYFNRCVAFDNDVDNTGKLTRYANGANCQNTLVCLRPATLRISVTASKAVSCYSTLTLIVIIKQFHHQNGRKNVYNRHRYKDWSIKRAADALADTIRRGYIPVIARPELAATNVTAHSVSDATVDQILWSRNIRSSYSICDN